MKRVSMTPELLTMILSSLLRPCNRCHICSMYASIFQLSLRMEETLLWIYYLALQQKHGNWQLQRPGFPVSTSQLLWGGAVVWILLPTHLYSLHLSGSKQYRLTPGSCLPGPSGSLWYSKGRFYWCAAFMVCVYNIQDKEKAKGLYPTLHCVCNLIYQHANPKFLGPVSQQNLKSSSDLKHGKDNGYQGD